MAKPIVFISHIHEDAQLARCLKEFLDDAFLGAFSIFVSSDGASIRAGDRWSSAIENALSDASIVLALISPEAKERRWILFECGGAYFARKPVVPICCRQFLISGLTPPLSWLQAIDGSDAASVGRLIDTVAQSHDLRPPRCDVSALVSYLRGTPCHAQQTSNAGAAAHQRGFPLYLVIDTSGSMRGEPIEHLSASIRKLLDELPGVSSEIAPMVSIIAFGDAAHEVVPLSPLSASTHNFELSAGGATALGSALHLLARRLADRSQLPVGHLAPMIVVFSDGQPTDDWESGLAAAARTEVWQSARKVCVALGSGPDLGVLRAIAGDSVVSVPELASVAGLAPFFSWVASVPTSGASRAIPGTMSPS
ncbi:MAG TPA: TIR domain-containing protein [Acidobacteriaceae bacterium]|nr:TIR domain-containing protein [Acidobacteriaceae bacterium]